jgi:hypothetical protein
MAAIRPARAGESDTTARTIEHVVASIRNAAERREPFLHITFNDAFPADIYAEMIAAMPQRGLYRRMSGRAKNADVRTKIDLFPEWVRQLPDDARPVWRVVGQALTSAPVRAAVMQRLAPALERRFGAADVGMYPVPILTRDVPGYQIGIHPDTRWKAITVQIYLPRDRSIEHVGTVFHTKRPDGTYEVAARMPFRPNSGYAFAVGDDTYHSVDKVGPEVRTRDSIILTYFADRTLAEIAQNRWKRFANYVRAGARALARP